MLLYCKLLSYLAALELSCSHLPVLQIATLHSCCSFSMAALRHCGLLLRGTAACYLAVMRLSFGWLVVLQFIVLRHCGLYVAVFRYCGLPWECSVDLLRLSCGDLLLTVLQYCSLLSCSAETYM